MEAPEPPDADFTFDIPHATWGIDAPGTFRSVHTAAVITGDNAPPIGIQVIKWSAA
jgi:hypothetical protein